MSKLLLATVSIVLVVFVTADKDTEVKNTDLSIQTNLLTRKVREADTKRTKKKTSGREMTERRKEQKRIKQEQRNLKRSPGTNTKTLTATKEKRQRREKHENGGN